MPAHVRERMLNRTVRWVSDREPGLTSFCDSPQDLTFALVSQQTSGGITPGQTPETGNVSVGVTRYAMHPGICRNRGYAGEVLLPVHPHFQVIQHGGWLERPNCFFPSLYHVGGNITYVTGIESESPSVAKSNTALETRFRALADQWRLETGPLSSSSKIAAHPAYQEIIGMGPAAISLVLRELQERPDHWFAALRALSGENPVPREFAGRVPKMRELWLEWGREKGYIS